MRLWYVADSQIPSRTANSVHVMRMCQAYARLGHRVTLLVPRWRHGIEPAVADVHRFYGLSTRFSVRRVPRPRLRWDTLYFGLLFPAIARLGRPALVHTRTLAVAWGAATLLRLPTVYEAHHPPPDNPRQRRMLARLTRSPRLRALVVITRALAERYLDVLSDGVDPVIAPDGVDGDWLEGAVGREEARRRIGLDGHAGPVAVYTGHLYPGRGVELILDLARRRPEVLFLLIGGRAEDVARCREGGRGNVPANARFVGFRPPAEVPLYLRAADVLLMPYADRLETAGGSDSAAYASPMKLFEYMAAGRPILASTLPVLREVLVDGTNALLLPYHRPERWSEALERLRRDPGLAERLAAAARADAGRYTWEARARSILESAGWTRS